MYPCKFKSCYPHQKRICGCGGIGRHVWFRFICRYKHAGSSPVTRTKKLWGRKILEFSFYLIIWWTWTIPAEVVKKMTRWVIFRPNILRVYRAKYQRFATANICQVPSTAPKQYNPNQIFPVGGGFGLFVYFEKFEDTHFKNGIIKRPNSKPRGPRKPKKQSWLWRIWLWKNWLVVNLTSIPCA